MSEHPWIQENLAAYLAGGLDATETSRLEQHVAGCKRACWKKLGMSINRCAVRGLGEPGRRPRHRTLQNQARRWPHVLRYALRTAA